MKCNQFKAACMKFKVDDYVYVYIPSVAEATRLVATVVAIDLERGLQLEIKGKTSKLWWHPRQLRVVNKNDLTY